MTVFPLYDYGVNRGGCLALEGAVPQLLPQGACVSAGTIELLYEGDLTPQPVQGSVIRACGTDLAIEDFGSVGFGGQPPFGPLADGRSSFAVDIGGTPQFGLVEFQNNDSAQTVVIRVRRSDSPLFPSLVGAACGSGR